MSTAFIFPGQGAQSVGMLKDLYNNISVVKSTVLEADEILGFKLSEIMFNGPEDELSLTYNTQPALFIASAAITRAALESTGMNIDQLCSFVAGHSLGEYSALYAAGSISFEDGLKITKARGVAMQNACPEGVGAMAACLGISDEELDTVLKAQDIGICEVANDNTESQKVISGDVAAVDYVIQKLKEIGKKAIKLRVSAAFHSTLMQPALPVMEQELANIDIKMPKVPVISNFTARNYTNTDEIRRCLVQQISGKVRWRETIDYTYANGVTHFVEVGVGEVLTNMLKRDERKFILSSMSNTPGLGFKHITAI